MDTEDRADTGNTCSQRQLSSPSMDQRNSEVNEYPKCQVPISQSLNAQIPIYYYLMSLISHSINANTASVNSKSKWTLIAFWETRMWLLWWESAVCAAWRGSLYWAPLVVPGWSWCRGGCSGPAPRRAGHSAAAQVCRHIDSSPGTWRQGAALREISQCPSRGLLLLLIVNLNTLHKNHTCRSVWLANILKAPSVKIFGD